MVEEEGPRPVPDLSALVAHEGAFEVQPLDPGQGAGEGPPGAGDDVDAGRPEAVERRDIALVEAEVQRDDGPVEVEREEFGGQRATSSR